MTNGSSSNFKCTACVGFNEKLLRLRRKLRRKILNFFRFYLSSGKLNFTRRKLFVKIFSTKNFKGFAKISSEAQKLPGLRRRKREKKGSHEGEKGRAADSLD